MEKNNYKISLIVDRLKRFHYDYRMGKCEESFPGFDGWLRLIAMDIIKDVEKTVVEGDKIKTLAWSDFNNEVLTGTVKSIVNQNCLDGSKFEKIWVAFDDGRTLPCIREELEKYEKE
jgi:hypothetical protein